jgi:SAM-dependent methyltransferase
MNCRVCASPATVLVATFKPYLDYETSVFDCSACGCRFAPHDVRAHEMLHATHSSYDSHAHQGAVAAEFFTQGHIKKLRAYLSKTEKYRFVIDFIDQRSSITKIAEIGSSKGYLSSYFIATGKKIHGFDISETAVQEANRTFGPHFHVMNEGTLQRLGAYDVIFHVGTIGCVEKPIEMTHRLLSLLKPGGWLIFNAPVREHLDALGTLWLATPPPDLVTIFPIHFWKTRFGSVADVDVSVSRCSVYDNYVYTRNSRRTQAPSASLFGQTELTSASSLNQRIRRYIGQTLRRVTRMMKSPLVSPYGAFVVLRNNTAH